MSNQPHARILLAALFLVAATFGSGQELRPPSDPKKGFDFRAVPTRAVKATSATPDAGRIDPSSPIVALPQHGNVNGGMDHGYNNVGVVFGARIYAGNLVNAIELFYYVPSHADNLYRQGDYRDSTGRIGGNGGSDGGGYYCPEGYAVVGLQGASGLAIDRVGAVCGQIGNLANVVSLPVFGGNGGNAFYDNCSSTRSLGFLTGVRVRSGAWMDSIQGLCQASGRDTEAPSARAKAVVKVADDLAAAVTVGTEQSEVLQKLGQPYSKISGDFEIYTYQLESGGTLRLELEEGRVTRVKITGGR